MSLCCIMKQAFVLCQNVVATATGGVWCCIVGRCVGWCGVVWPLRARATVRDAPLFMLVGFLNIIICCVGVVLFFWGAVFSVCLVHNGASRWR